MSSSPLRILDVYTKIGHCLQVLMLRGNTGDTFKGADVCRVFAEIYPDEAKVLADQKQADSSYHSLDQYLPGMLYEYWKNHNGVRLGSPTIDQAGNACYSFQSK